MHQCLCGYVGLPTLTDGVKDPHDHRYDPRVGKVTKTTGSVLTCPKCSRPWDWGNP